MYRSMIILMACWLAVGSMCADDSLPIIEVKADRTMIYPQRMDLNGEESLMDVLQMMPELMIRGYEDVLDACNLRTDLYANATYRYQKGHKECVSLHMTNRFDERNRLLTYLTQQYLAMPDGHSQKIMGRARYFHTFNDLGTELLVLGGYQYASDPVYANQLPMFVLELNTPLPVKGLTLLAGVEGDYQMTKQRGADKSWNMFNHDIYLQFTYSLPKWRFTVGHRVMLYNYRLADSLAVQKRFDVRNNTTACVIFVPNSRHQIQVGYFRKFMNPAYLVLPMQADTVLRERDINQVKVAYAYSRQRLTVQPEASYYIVEGDENYGEIAASAYWRTKWVTLTGGANLYIAIFRDNGR